MRCYAEFITTPTIDIPGTCLLLHFDDRRYLIGQLTEGTQRTCTERHLGLRKVGSILLTGHMQWANVGGLLGMVLQLAEIKGRSREQAIEDIKSTLANKGITSMSEIQARSQKYIEESKVNILGPPNINHMIATARRFIFRRGTPMKVEEYSASKVVSPKNESCEPTWSDDWVRVWALPILPTTSADGIQDMKRRKRSHDEFEEENTKSSDPCMEPSSDADDDDAIRQTLVSKMFNSDWRPDRLVSQRLSQVKMPAAVFLRDPHSKELIQYTGPMPGSNENFPDIEVLVREPWPGAKTENLPATIPRPDAISYIISNHAQRGKFMPKKAIELGVPQGRLWSELASGRIIETAEGKQVTPDMVLQPGKHGGGMAVIDLPSVEYIQPLIERPEWNVEKIMAGVEVFVWILGPGLAAHEKIRRFQSQMSHMKHIVSAIDCCPQESILKTATTMALRHNHLDPIVFPMLRKSQSPLVKLDSSIIMAQPGLAFTLAPQVGLETERIASPFDTEAAKSRIIEEQETVQRAIGKSETSSKNEITTDDFAFGDAEIIVLGTGSSHPSRTRNVSGTLVRVPGCGSYLFDCGEGTLGTLNRVFSPEELNEVLLDLRMIWVSHLHADHHLGLASVLKARFRIIKNISSSSSCAVVSDTAMLQWLYEYSSAEEIGISNILPLVARPIERDENLSLEQGTTLHYLNSSKRNDLGDPDSTARFIQKLNLKSLNSVRVNHCHGAQAVAITFANGLKISYSGDCRPSASFAVIGRDSHVLIHEATFEDAMRSEAVAKKHSTSGEALIVASKMKAQACLLTHFSQRYPKMPPVGAVLSRASDRHSTSIEDLSSVLEDADHTQQAAANDVSDGTARLEIVVDNLRAPKPDTEVALSAASGNSHGINLKRTGLIKESDVRRLLAASGMKVIFAFDFMRLKLKDIPRMEQLQPLMRRLYDYLSEEHGGDETFIDDVDEDRVAMAEQKQRDKKSKKKEKSKQSKGKMKMKE